MAGTKHRHAQLRLSVLKSCPLHFSNKKHNFPLSVFCSGNDYCGPQVKRIIFSNVSRHHMSRQISRLVKNLRSLLVAVPMFFKNQHELNAICFQDSLFILYSRADPLPVKVLRVLPARVMRLCLQLHCVPHNFGQKSGHD